MPTQRQPKHKSARDKLQLSRLDLTQQELMGDDIDLEKFYIQMKGKTGINAVDRIVSADVTRTIEGASTLEIGVKDPGLELLNSPLLHSHCDVKIDGLWFRLCKIGKQQDIITLTFEDREIAVLRTYTKPIKQSGRTSRNQGVTRAEFILRLLREVKEFKIPYVIPELHKTQEIDDATKTQDQATRNQQRQYGISDSEQLTVKGNAMTPEQRKNANIVLDTGVSMNAPQPVMVMSMMAAIQESSIRNLPQPKPGDSNYRSPIPSQNPVGVFQQIKFYNWPATRDVAKDAHEFFKRLISEFSAHRSLPLYDQIEAVQHSGHPRYYAAWHPEAKQIVAAYYGGDTGTQQQQQWNAQDAGQDNEYEFYRGRPESRADGSQIWKPESSWECIQRLAGEVNKKAFFVSGTFYFISEPELFKSQLAATIKETAKGIDYIEFDLDINKSAAQVDVRCDMGRWFAPPGSVIKINEMGPITGRWLVSDVERSLYERKGQITLIKPDPQLPEPSGGNVQKDDTTGQWTMQNGNQDGLSMEPSAIAKRAVAYARKQLGDPYQWGAEGPDRFDCSGLIQAAYISAGYFGMPRVAQAQFEFGKKLLADVPLIPGDLVFFGTRHNIHHVGMVIRPGQMIDAPHTGAVVRIEPYDNWADFYGATRPTAK